MNLVLRLLVACFVITAPTLLFLGLCRGLEKLRDDGLLMRLAESDDAPRDVSSAAAEALEKGPIRADGDGSDFDGPSAEAFACGSCGASNMLGSKYCRECLDELE